MPADEVKAMVEPFIQTLSLQWRFEYVNEVAFIAIDSNRTENTHTINWNSDVFGKDPVAALEAKRGLLHELCHAKLAETIHPLFAGARLHSSCVSNQYDRTRFDESTRFIDTWVNDLYFATWPNDFAEHIAIFMRRSLGFVRKQLWHMLGRHQIPFSVAQYLSDTARHDIQPLDISLLLKKVTASDRREISKLAEFAINLAPLSGEQDADLSLLELSVQQVARLLNNGLKPVIVEEDGRMVWKF